MDTKYIAQRQFRDQISMRTKPSSLRNAPVLFISLACFTFLATFNCFKQSQRAIYNLSRPTSSVGESQSVVDKFPHQFNCTGRTDLGTGETGSFYISSGSKSHGLECLLKELAELNDGVVVTLPGQYGFPDGLALRKSRTVPSYYCFTFFPTKDRFVSGAFFDSGLFDEHVLKFIRDVVLHEKQRQPGHKCRMIDAGTNIGIVSLYAAALGCQVDSFEMQNRTRELFMRSVQINGFDSKIKLHAGAIHYKSGMHVDISLESEYKDNIGGVTMMLSEPLPGPAHDDHYQADTVVIHDSVNYDDDITVMKIDVEGAEELVLRSSTNLWKAGHIRHLIMETRQTQFGMFEQLFEANFV